MNRLSIIILFCTFFYCSLPACSQTRSGYKPTKQAAKYFQEAESAFNFGDDLGALNYLEKAVDEDPNFIDAWFTLGGIYLYKYEQFDKAIKAFETVYKLDNGYNTLTILNIAEAYFLNQQYDEAEGAANSYLKQEGISKSYRIQAEYIAKSSVFARQAIKNPLPYQPINLGPKVNSDVPEYFPAVTADEEFLYFTRHSGKGKFFNEDIYSSENKDGVWQTSKVLPPPVNSLDFNEGAHTISPDGRYLIFTSCDRIDSYGSCDIYITKKIGDNWGRPNNMGNKINSGAWETQPSISPDGKSLYFVSNRKGGYGKSDIYVSHMEPNGAFGAPINLGPKINSYGSEERPFIHPDNQTLYFASDGHPGLGKTDIFYSKKDAKGFWEDPINAGYPINTPGDEPGIFVNTEGTKGYFTSDRAGGYGENDIYYFEIPKKMKPGTVTFVKGKVYDNNTKKPLQANIQLIDLESGETITTLASDAVNGNFLVTIPAGKNYAYSVSKEGYLFHSENFSLSEPKEDSKPYYIDIPLKPIAVGQSIVLKNIFFETGKYDLMMQSKVELDELLKLLQGNKTMVIEIGGHTDDVGSDSDNLILSENRAKEVFTYLTGKGIETTRISFKGYGETAPIATNDTPEGKAQNRRTEFTVLRN